MRQLLSQSCSRQTTARPSRPRSNTQKRHSTLADKLPAHTFNHWQLHTAPEYPVDNKTPIAAIDRSLSRSCPRAGAASSDAIITAAPTTNEPFLNLTHTRISLARLPALVQHGVDRELAVVNIHDWATTDSIAQVFRIAADLSHTTSKCILIFSIHRNRSSEGMPLGLPLAARYHC